MCARPWFPAAHQLPEMLDILDELGDFLALLTGVGVLERLPLLHERVILLRQLSACLEVRFDPGQHVKVPWTLSWQRTCCYRRPLSPPVSPLPAPPQRCGTRGRAVASIMMAGSNCPVRAATTTMPHLNNQ